MIPLDLTSTAYSHAAALHLGELSRLAYLPAPEACGGALALGYTEARLIDSGRSTQVLLAVDANRLVVAFRGTEPARLDDLVADAEACLTQGPGGRVHRGFLGALREVERDLERALADLGRCRSLWLTGHSLGGALATLAAAYLGLELDRPVHGVYTFGSPRVGSRAFARSYDSVLRSRTWRIARAGDLAARMPPRAMFYSHVGEDLFIAPGGELIHDPGGWLRELSTVEADLEAVGHLEVAGLAEHRLDGYLAALAAQAVARG